MKVIRPIKSSDSKAYEKFAFTASLGLTNLPKNPSVLKQKISSSLASFSKESDEKNPLYIFVLEDLETGELLGTSSIAARVEGPLYFYRIETLSATSSLPHATSMIKVLRPISYPRNVSESGGLYIFPELRSKGIGRLLSQCRFLFTASFPNRFEETIISELRGLHENNTSAFWEGVGRHFLDVSLEEALDLSIYNKAKIGEILPQYPIYISLLPKEVQATIGQIHHSTQPALRIIKEEGYYFTNEIDIIDAGPKYRVKKGETRTAQESIIAIVDEIITESIEDQSNVISNERLDFRACFGSVKETAGSRVAITAEVAEALKIKKGEAIRYITSRPKDKQYEHA